jgi:hypothetical protein
LGSVLINQEKNRSGIQRRLDQIYLLVYYTEIDLFEIESAFTAIFSYFLPFEYGSL